MQTHTQILPFLSPYTQFPLQHLQIENANTCHVCDRRHSVDHYTNLWAKSCDRDRDVILLLAAVGLTLTQLVQKIRRVTWENNPG